MMATKPNYSALSKLNGTYAYAPYGSREGVPVGSAVIAGVLYSLWEVSPETAHLPKIQVSGRQYRKPVLHIQNIRPAQLLNRTIVLPITLGTVMLMTFDFTRGMPLCTVFPASDAEKEAIIRWAQEENRKVVAGSANYTIL